MKREFKRYWILTGQGGYVDILPGIGSGLRTVHVWIDEKKRKVHIRADFTDVSVIIPIGAWENDIPHHEAYSDQQLGDILRHLRAQRDAPACRI